MARTDDDSWDITESVGTTALGVAMVRAAESDCDCPLFTDRYAPFSIDAATRRGRDYSESWNSITAARESTDSLSAASRSAADGAANTA